jgi:hypothetical protein
MDLYKLQYRRKGDKTWKDVLTVDPMVFKGKFYKNESPLVCSTLEEAEAHIKELKKAPDAEQMEYRAVKFEPDSRK